ncbi:MAG: stage II sporulation protein R [Anaerovoracaceae bacterium]
MKLRKNQIRLMFFLLLSLFVYSWFITADSAGVLSNEDFIRFHVVANSNSSEDQRLKLIVRDELLKNINEGLTAETMATADTGQSKVTLDIDRSKEFIEENLTELEKKARGILSKQGCDDPVRANLDVAWIPQKTYGDVTFPAGNYNALTVTIGQGQGENWWCVLFPPLCLIGLTPEGDGEMEDLYKEAILDDKYSVLLEESEKPKTLILKFKTLDLLNP